MTQVSFFVCAAFISKRSDTKYGSLSAVVPRFNAASAGIAVSCSDTDGWRSNPSLAWCAILIARWWRLEGYSTPLYLDSTQTANTPNNTQTLHIYSNDDHLIEWNIGVARHCECA
jgi:hypothetical protein